MSETENPLDSRRLPFAVILAGIIVLGAFVVTGSAGGGNSPLGHFNTNISFIGVAMMNQTALAQCCITTPVWTPIQNETLMVVASTSGSFAASQVSSVTDTHGDVFTKIIRVALPPGGVEPGSDLEVWSGTDGSTFVPNAVTVNWNESSNAHLVQVVRYQDVASFGVTASRIGPPLLDTTISVTASKSGSWLFGTITVLAIPADPVSTPCPGDVVSDSLRFITRNEACSVPGSTDGTETWVSDNATAVRNGITVPYAPNISAGNAVFFLDAEIEMIPVDVEPQSDTNIYCQTTGDSCHNNAVTKTSGINTLQTLLLGTTYCTGITTTALTTTKTAILFGSSTYSGQSRNVTGAIMLVTFKVGTNAPTTSFGSGVCASGGLIFATTKIMYQTSGLTTTAYGLNEYAQTILGSFSQNAGTYYAWDEIAWQGCNPACAGSTMLFAQWGAAQHSSIQMNEQV